MHGESVCGWPSRDRRAPAGLRAAARGAGLERARGARAGAPGGGPASRDAGRLDAAELSNPRPRVRLFPGAGRRGTDRAAPAGQGGRAGRGSVLAGPQPQQAGDARLARRRLPPDRHRVPPRPSRHRHQQLRRHDPDRRGRRGARRDRTRSRGPAWRSTTTRSATRSPSAPRGGEVTVREVQVRPRSFERPLIVGTMFIDHRDRRAGPVPLQLHPVGVPRPAARGHHHRAGERPLRGALLASLPAGDRDPASDQLPRLSGARHHPGPLGDRGLRPERGASAGGAWQARPSADWRDPSPATRLWDRPLDQTRSRVSPRRSTHRTWTRSGSRSSESPALGRWAAFPRPGSRPAR